MAKKGKGKGKGKKGKGKKGKAEDIDPLSPEFQLIKAKTQIESLEHQLMCAAQTVAPRPLRAMPNNLCRRRHVRAAARSSLPVDIRMRTDAATRAIQTRDGLQEAYDQLKTDFDSERATTVAISANMTRQYKAMQDDFVQKINDKEAVILQLKVRRCPAGGGSSCARTA